MVLRIVFMGTPQFSVPSLQAIAANGHQVVAVYSQPPRPAGRGMADRKSPVHEAAEALGSPVLTPKSLKGADEQEIFRAHGADAVVVIAYGLLLPKPVLEAPRFGCYNLHASKLPRWRGAAPIQRAIMAGDAETAAIVMRMDEGLDTGPVCLETAVSIGHAMTAGELHDALSIAGAPLVIEALDRLEAGTLPSRPQAAEGVTYAAKIEKQEARMDFSRSAIGVHNHVRGLSPFPGAWFEAAPEGGKPERIKVLRTEVVDLAGEPGVALDSALTIGCGQGAVRLIDVQRAGKRVMDAQEFLRGFSFPKDSRVGA